jgi:hypothetical protein
MKIRHTRGGGPGRRPGPAARDHTGARPNGDAAVRRVTGQRAAAGRRIMRGSSERTASACAEGRHDRVDRIGKGLHGLDPRRHLVTVPARAADDHLNRRT